MELIILFMQAGLLFIVFVAASLPLYFGGKMAKLMSEKFTYISCLGTAIASGIVTTILATITTAIIGRIANAQIMSVLQPIISIAWSVLVLGYFVKKSYGATNKQVAIMYFSMLLFGVAVSLIFKLIRL